MTQRFDAVLFDLLTALIDSWTLWNDIAGGEAEGMAWRRAYLDITYGCGAYRPYEDLVAEAAAAAGQPPEAAKTLAARWQTLSPWPEVALSLAALPPGVKRGVVTNCSAAMGRVAAACAAPDWDVIVTAEEAGFYKPRPEPYRLALDRLGTAPSRTLFVAGSAADVPGAQALGMPVYWHNRIGLAPKDGAAPEFHHRSLEPLAALI